MKILCLGNEFIEEDSFAKEIGKKLIKKGFNVVGIDNDLRAYLFGKDASTKEEGKRLQIEYKNFKLLSIDIRDEKKIVRAFKEEGPFDFIIHAAAQPAHEFSTNHPLYNF